MFESYTYGTILLIAVLIKPEIVVSRKHMGRLSIFALLILLTERLSVMTILLFVIVRIDNGWF